MTHVDVQVAWDMQEISVSRPLTWQCACVFRKASNALATRDNGELKHGIDLSKRLQRAILE